MINIRRDLFKNSIEPGSLRIEANISNTSGTGIVTGTSTGLVTALDLKNPFGGAAGVTEKSFFGVPWNPAMSANLDSATSALTIETILRPYNNNAVILWRRLSSSAWAGTTTETQNSFMKLELTKNPDDTRDAFRFYIRTVTANGTFTESFAKKNVQASGLFVPGDVGVNIFDGKFHHLVVSWGVNGVDGSSTTVESGAGAVLGYVDGYKLLNREQTDPRLGGADAAGGPVVQANMYEQRVPIRTSSIEYTDPEDGSTSAGNNLYIGVSNFNRDKTDTAGDRGVLCSSGDSRLAGAYDGQVQHFRMWNIRLTDGTTGIKDGINKTVSSTSNLGISFSNFKNSSLTAGATTSAGLIAWFNFRERNTLSALDVSQYAITGAVVGRANINLYDVRDTTVSGDNETDTTLSSTNRTFLYVDNPEKNIINNDYSQGRILRRAVDGTMHRTGIVYYELGVIALDNDDDHAKLNFLWPASGTTGDFGFSVTGINNCAFNFERIVFNSIDNRARLILSSVVSGSELNYTQNSSGINRETGNTIFDDPTTYITSVGLYNDQGDLLAVGKLSSPAKKDVISKIQIDSRLDF